MLEKRTTARLVCMVNESKLSIIRPRENSIPKQLDMESVEGMPSFLWGIRMITFLPG